MRERLGVRKRMYVHFIRVGDDTVRVILEPLRPRFMASCGALFNVLAETVTTPKRSER